jgi:hypothetical protein
MDHVTTSVDPSWWRPIGMHGSASLKVDFTGVEIEQHPRRAEASGVPEALVCVSRRG